jgi:hypothetical protein
MRHLNLPPDKYLFFRAIEHPQRTLTQSAGLLHCTHLFERFLSLAASMRRTAVIEGVPYGVMHNNGRPVPADPRIYYDLDNILCFGAFLSQQGRKLNYILEQDFDMCRFAPEDIVYLRIELSWSRKGIMSKQQAIINQAHTLWRDHPLIILEGHIEDYKPQWYSFLFKSIPLRQQCGILLSWSHNVRQLAMDTIRQLCDDNNVETIKEADQSSLTGNTDSTAKPFENNYWVIHARREDKDDAGDRRKWFDMWNALSVPSNILANLRRIKGFNKNTIIYLMSNETDPAYYKALKAIHPGIHTYHDFPKLKALIHSNGNHTPNNYLLFAVERAIWDNASRRITTRRQREKLKAIQIQSISPGCYIAMLALKLNRVLGRINTKTR